MDLLLLAQKWLGESTYSKKTRESYLISLRLLQRRFPAHSVQSFCETDLIQFLTQDETGRASKQAPNSVITRRNALRSFFSWAELEGLVPQDPARRLNKRVNPKRQGVKQHRWLKRDEIQLLLASADADGIRGLRDKVIIVVGLTTGLRREELSQMKWKHVNLDRRELLVLGKGGKLAVLGITQQAHDVLKEWRQAIESDGWTIGADDPVLTAIREVPMSVEHVLLFPISLGIRGVGQAVDRRAHLAGVGHLEPHDLRRSFNGLLKAQGRSLEDRQAAMRHSSPVTTQKVYDEADPTQALRAVEGLEL